MVTRLLASSALVLVAAAPLPSAHAQYVEEPERVYFTDPPRRFALPPPVVVHPSPSVVHVVTPPHAVYVGEVEDLEPSDPSSDLRMVVGARAGGLIASDRGVNHVASLYEVNLGVGVRATSFLLNFGHSPEAFRLRLGGDTLIDAAMYTLGAAFEHAFLPDAVLHPIIGAGLGGVIVNPKGQAENGRAFSVMGRAGLEFRCDVSGGVLGLGIDVTGHRTFAATQAYAADIERMLSFGAYMNYAW